MAYEVVTPDNTVDLPWLFNALHTRLFQGIGLRVPGVRRSDIRVEFIASLGDVIVTYTPPDGEAEAMVFDQQWFTEQFDAGLFRATDAAGKAVLGRWDAIDIADTTAFHAYEQLAKLGRVPPIAGRPAWGSMPMT